jgi:hypothetical protein
MWTGQQLSAMILLAAPFGAAAEICKSETNTFTVKVDLFASELGTYYVHDVKLKRNL